MTPATMNFDAIRTIEACYAAAPDERAWLQNVLESLEPLTRGLPPVAHGFRIAAGRLHEFAMAPEFNAQQAAALKRFWESASPEIIRVWFSPVPPVVMISNLVKRTPSEHLDELYEGLDIVRIRDALTVLAFEPDGRGLVVCVPYVEPVRIPPQTLRQLRCVAAHIGTALRLRSRRRIDAADSADVEAVLDPEGKVHHAAGPARAAEARDALAGAVHAVERARGELRRTGPDDAAAAWQGLVEGRWSLIDHMECDGRRFVLARRNEPAVQDVKALVPRERDVLAFAALGHSNKHIGYTLGIAPNTVGAHLASAMMKLGLRSRRELIAMFGPMARAPGVA